MQQGKKRKLVDKVNNIIISFLNYMKLEVDDDDFYEEGEATKKEKIIAMICIVASFVTLIVGIAISIVVVLCWF